MTASFFVLTFGDVKSHMEEEVQMTPFMDVHTIEGGVSAGDVAGAHVKDLETQGKFGVRYLHYWVNDDGGRIFCLVEATVHRDAHGLVADEIYPLSKQS